MPWYKGQNISTEEYRRKTTKTQPKPTGTQAFTERTHKKPGRVGGTVQKTTGLDKLQETLTNRPKPTKPTKKKPKLPTGQGNPKKKPWYKWSIYDLFR